SSAGPGGHRLGLLYVWATLLPLVSFTILLILGGVKNLARRYRDNRFGEAVYETLGGDRPSRWGGFLATAAIAGSFVLCLIGFGYHLHDHSPEAMANQWTDRVPFISIGWYPKSLPGGSDAMDQRGAVTLELGYKIDHLSTIMFLMVTF